MRAVVPALAILTILSAGCATPKAIEGRQVQETKWVDGHMVYRTKETDADRKEMKKKAAEAIKAATSTVFDGSH